MSISSEPDAAVDPIEPEPLEALGVVATAFRNAVVGVLGEADSHPSPLVDVLQKHFGGVDPGELPVVTHRFENFFQLNFQAALDEFMAVDGREARVVGAYCPTAGERRQPVSLSAALFEPSLAWDPIVMTPAEYDFVPCGSDDKMVCLRQGLVLFRDSDGPWALWARGYGSPAGGITFDLMHPSAERAAEIFEQWRERGYELNPYRGHIIEVGLENDMRFQRKIRFLPRPAHTDASDVILPAGLLEQIEEHTIDVVRARPALQRCGRHLKRGVLLHGRPGTGKTHTIRYLISQIPDATVLVMPAEAAGEPERIDAIHQIIDVIQPGVIIFDDVDFIAEDRSLPGQTKTRDSLFALLELLDGIAEDADLLFVLTTNRPNKLEPAVAARPGRIDQAIEVPLPDADCRKRLLEHYSRHGQLVATDDEVARIVERTEGVTASFIRELVRRAVTAHILRGAGGAASVSITAEALEAALDVMLDPDRPLSAVLLGAEPQHPQLQLASVQAASLS